MKIMDVAREKMRNTGNARQWVDGYPSRQVIEHDIEQGGGRVIVENGALVAYFAFLPSPEPTYATIDHGNWVDTGSPYMVVHRMGSKDGVKGIFNTALDYCFEHCNNIRLDTHHDNTVMQHLIERYGFKRCGIIHLASGAPRIAYQLLQER